MNYKTISLQNLPLPTLSIQITKACNYSCLQCDFQRSIRTSKDKSPTHMPVEYFSEILNQYKSYPQNMTKKVVLSAGAEPMMHPQFIDICRLLDQAGISFTFDTNVSLLDIEKSKMLLSFQWFKRIAFSVDGFTPNVFESIRRGSSHNLVVNNILNFLSLAKEYGRNDVVTEVNMVLQEKNAHEVEKIILYWTPLVSQVNISSLRIGTKYASPNWLPDERTSCNFLRKYMRILTDGKVVFCCIDGKFSSEIGDMNTSSLEEIWNGKEYQKLREAHDSGNYGYLPICDDCQAWAGFYQPRDIRNLNDSIMLGTRPVNIVATRINKNSFASIE